MAINKVVYGNDTLIDLTNDTVDSSNLLEGETAHNRAGSAITGTAKQGHIIWNAIKTALSPQRLKLWFADAKVTDDSTEQATKVEVVQLIDDESELTNAPDGVYQGDYDDAPEDVLDASMVAYKDGSVEDALDNVTGYGTNANGTYYKFADGTLICTKVFTTTVSITASWGVLYETSNPVSFGDWAHSFISTPVASLTVANDEGLACVPERLSGVSASSAGRSLFFRPTTGSGPLTVNLIAIGRWK